MKKTTISLIIAILIPVMCAILIYALYKQVVPMDGVTLGFTCTIGFGSIFSSWLMIMAYKSHKGRKSQDDKLYNARIKQLERHTNHYITQVEDNQLN